MKKLLASIIALSALTGCVYYDYYKGGVRYTQDGEDCVYYVAEQGRRYSSEIDSLKDVKKVVYKNTRCADLYAKDNFGQPERQDRKIMVPAAREVSYGSFGCSECAKPVLKRRYVIVASAM